LEAPLPKVVDESTQPIAPPLSSTTTGDSPATHQ